MRNLFGGERAAGRALFSPLWILVLIVAAGMVSGVGLACVLHHWMI
jgi:hypothetical protein